MNIEFYTPQGQVKEWVLNFVRGRLLEFHQRDKEISASRVTFRKDAADENSKICEIDVTIYGDSLFECRNAGSYEQAARDVLAVLEEKINEQVAKLNEPPEEVTSTVEVL